MRVVEANDLKPAPARRAPAIDVIRGIDQKPCRRRLGNVARRHGLDNLVAAPEQQSTTFERRELSSVPHDRRDDTCRQTSHVDF